MGGGRVRGILRGGRWYGLVRAVHRRGGNVRGRVWRFSLPVRGRGGGCPGLLGRFPRLWWAGVGRVGSVGGRRS